MGVKGGLTAVVWLDVPELGAALRGGLAAYAACRVEGGTGRFGVNDKKADTRSAFA